MYFELYHCICTVEVSGPVGYRQGACDKWIGRIGRIAYFADESEYLYYHTSWRHRGDTVVYAEVQYKDVNRRRQKTIPLL